jgi:ABC-type glycerol-3-phosphate transport system substrate-binding protein
MSINTTNGGDSDDVEAADEGDVGSMHSRRDVVKAATAAAGAGALGALAGGASAQSGGSQSVTIDYLSANAAENSAIRQHFQQSMQDFQQKNGSVTVNLQTASYGDIKTKIASTVQGGNPPALAESGSGGLPFYFNDQLADHSKFFEGTEGFPDNFTGPNKEVAQFRGDWWSAGALRHTSSNLGIRPKIFSQVGVENPLEDLATWSQFYDAISQIDEQMDTIAYEETGAPNDLESYWGQARTAYTEGTDPWIRGDPENPDVIINNPDMEEDRRRTDGMIKNCVTLANQFSSQESASRNDEEIPSLMLTGRVASFTYATPTARRWFAVKEDASIGWNGGDGDFMLLPNPRLDPEYGSKVGISELEGLEGQHGGHVWGLEQCHTIFNGVSQQQQQAAWDLMVYLMTDNDFVLPAWGEHYQSIPGMDPKMDELLNQYTDLPQNFNQAIENMDQYAQQYANTGGAWDVRPTDPIRWTDINETISQAIAGQHDVGQLPSLIRERVLTRLEQEN